MHVVSMNHLFPISINFKANASELIENFEIDIKILRL